MSDETTQSVTSNGTTNTTQPVAQSSMVPSFRLGQEREKRDAAIEKATSAEAQVEKLQSKLAELTTEYSSLQATHQQELHLVEIGFKAPSIRRFFRREYTAAIAELPADGVPSFNEWLLANKGDPLYSVHFGTLTTDEPDQTTAPEPDPVDRTDAIVEAVRASLNGNPDKGTERSTVTHASREYDVNEIRRIKSRNGGTLGEQKDVILANLRAQGVIK